MLREESSIVVHRPAAEVFKYLLEGENEPKWRENVLEARQTKKGEGCEGRAYEELVKGWRGYPHKEAHEITSCEDGREIDFTIVRKKRGRSASYVLEPQGDSTRIRFSIAANPKGIARLASPIVRARMRREVSSLARLKQQLEPGSERRRNRRIENEDLY